MSCSTRPAYVRPTRAWPPISSLRSSNDSSNQFASGGAALRHRVEAAHLLRAAAADGCAARGSARCARARPRAVPRARCRRGAPPPASRARSSSSVAPYSDSSVSDTYDHTGIERRAEQLGLERLEPGEVGPERHDPEIGLVAEHRHAHAPGARRPRATRPRRRRACRLRDRVRRGRGRPGSRGAGRPNRSTASPGPYAPRVAPDDEVFPGLAGRERSACRSPS